MNCRALMMALLLGILSFAQAEPKAYEVVNYRGKAGSVTIAFEFGDGYPEASTIKITDAASGKTTKFQMDDSGAMHFVPEKAGGTIKSISLKMDGDERAPAKVTGSYLTGGKSVPFTLTKSKPGK